MRNTKLTLAQYKEIKKEIGHFTDRFVAVHHDVSKSTIYRIKRSKSFADYRRMANPSKKVAIPLQPGYLGGTAPIKKQLHIAARATPATVTNEELLLELRKHHNEIRHLTALLENAHVYHASEVPKSSRRFFGLLK